MLQKLKFQQLMFQQLNFQKKPLLTQSIIRVAHSVPHIARISCTALLGIALFACDTVTTKSEPVIHDSGPSSPVGVAHIPDAVPKVELRTNAGNTSPYRVLGKTYRVMESPESYRERGVASWYGQKFHGRRTANSEIYNMYGMTAAHKSLPIPSYVRVTNEDNQRNVIVRVNDRGPFHGGRIIDLTYSAAKKLGFENTGTANVLVEYIDPKAYQQNASIVDPQPNASPNAAYNAAPAAPTPKHSDGYQLPNNTFLQVGAFSLPAGAQHMKTRLSHFTALPITIIAPANASSTSEPTKQLYRVQVGPFDDGLQLMKLRQKLNEAEFPSPHVVYQ